jgi:hypothetical protein
VRPCRRGALAGSEGGAGENIRCGSATHTMPGSCQARIYSSFAGHCDDWVAFPGWLKISLPWGRAKHTQQIPPGLPSDIER